MNKRKLLTLTLCFSLLLGCTPPAAGDPCERVFSELEKGNYSKGEDIIQTEILGNIQEESNAEKACADYAEQIINDYNNAEVSYEDVALFIDAMSRTTFSSYFQQTYLEQDFYWLSMSKEAYDDAIAYLKQDSYDDSTAARFFLDVMPDDVNFPDAVEHLDEIMSSLLSTGDLEKLKLASEIGEKLSAQVDSSPEILEQLYRADELQDNWLQAQLAYAKALEADHRYAYAIRQYSKIRHASAEAQDQLFWLQLRRNSWCHTSAGDYHVSGSIYPDPDNPPVLYWDEPIEAFQIDGNRSFDGIGTTTVYFVILDPDGELKVKIPDDIPEEEWAKRGLASLPQFAIHDVIKVGCTGMGFLALDDSGTLSAYGEVSSKMQEASSWTDLVDFWYANSDYIGLTADGHVLTTDDDLKDALSCWTDIVSVSTYCIDIGHSTESGVCGLKSDGTVCCVSWYGNVRHASVADVVQIAGNYLLNSSGQLLMFTSIHSGELTVNPTGHDGVGKIFPHGPFDINGGNAFCWNFDGYICGKCVN